jgi:adenylylsulfate kinase-like enzyme
VAKLIWITGLAGSGKTTISKEVYQILKSEECNTVHLDGDHFREITGSASGHSREDRFIVAMQIARLCQYLIAQEINVVCSTISLFKEVHTFNRIKTKSYIEVYIECPMDELIRRDQKGIYSKAIKGEMKDVVGIDIPFDEPSNCDIRINNSEKLDLNLKVKKIIDLVQTK